MGNFFFAMILVFAIALAVIAAAINNNHNGLRKQCANTASTLHSKNFTFDDGKCHIVTNDNKLVSF